MNGRTNRRVLHAMSLSLLLYAIQAHNEVVPIPPPDAGNIPVALPDSSEATGLQQNEPPGTEPQSELPIVTDHSAGIKEHDALHGFTDEKIKQEIVEIKKMLADLKDSLGCRHAEMPRRVNSPEDAVAAPARPVASEPSFYGYGRMALGFEEMGLAFRFRCTPHTAPEKQQLMITAGFGYDARIPTETYRTALNEWHVKAGVFRDAAVFDRLRLGVYLEVMEKMKQFETDPLLGEKTFNVYSVWATKARLGTILSIFCLRHFMLTYRIGIEGAYSTSPFYVNQDRTKLIKLGNGNFKAGLCGSETSMFEALFNNIGIFYSF